MTEPKIEEAPIVKREPANDWWLGHPLEMPATGFRLPLAEFTGQPTDIRDLIVRNRGEPAKS